MKAHESILLAYLDELTDKGIHSILDAGSGTTSLVAITSSYPDIVVDAVVYPGDERKSTSISRTCSNNTYRIMEKDICSHEIDKQYDLVVAHLLLGEAVKFNHSFHDLLSGLLLINAKYLVIIDYLEDPDVNLDEILMMAADNHYSIVCKTIKENRNPQMWDDFVGTHNFGLLLSRV